MNNKALTLSLVMALMAVFFVQSYVSSIEDEAKKKFGTEVLVVAAKKDITEMATIDETMLELKPIPKRFLEPGAVAYSPRQDQGAVLREMKELGGSVAIVPIKKGEQITLNKITEPSLRTGLSPQITPGRRAVSVPVNDVSGISKLVKPGDRVDIIAIVESTAMSRVNPLGQLLSKTILQDVGVLAVGRNVTNNIARILEPDGKNKYKARSLTNNDQFSSVTLEVEPAQAQVIALAVTGGAQLILSLRNNDDADRVTLSGMTMSDVLGPEAARMIPPAPQRAPAGPRGQGRGR